MKSLIALILIFGGLMATAKTTKKKSNPAASKTMALDKVLQDELLANSDIRYCYEKTEYGRDKKVAKFIYLLEVDPGGKVTDRKLETKLSSPENPEITNCLMDVLKSLIIPFRSNEKGKTLTVTFHFPVQSKKP